MGEMTLSKLQKKQYKEIVSHFQNKKIVNFLDTDYIRLKETLSILEVLGYITPINIDGTNAFRKIGDFKDFDIWHKDKVQEERVLSRREWMIAIVGGLIGGAIGLIPDIIQLLLNIKGVQ